MREKAGRAAEGAAPAKAPRRPARSRRGTVPVPRSPLLGALGIGSEDGMELASHEAQDARVLRALDALLGR